MNRRTFITDLDGVLYDFVGPVLQRLRYKFGVILDREDIVSYSLGSFVNDEAAKRDIISLLDDPEFHYHEIQPLPGAIEAMVRMSERANLVAVTARPNHLSRVTRLAIDRDFGKLFKEVHHTRTEYKHKYSMSYKAKWAVEDHGPTAMMYAKQNVQTYLVRQPWNHDTQRGRLLRPVSGIAEAVSCILTPLGERMEGSFDG